MATRDRLYPDLRRLVGRVAGFVSDAFFPLLWFWGGSLLWRPDRLCVFGDASAQSVHQIDHGRSPAAPQHPRACAFMLSFEPNASPFLMARAPEPGAPGRNLEWGTRCADAEEVEGRGGCTLRSLGTSADRDAARSHALSSSGHKFTRIALTLTSARRVW